MKIPARALRRRPYPFKFERFYKEDRSRGMNTRGSGLGLHICKILINLSGGQIHAESERKANGAGLCLRCQ